MQNDNLKHIKNRCFINAPWYDLKNKYLDIFVEHQIQPEIGLEGTCLYDEPIEEFERVSSLLREKELNCTLHAPFFDLSAGALDPHILDVTRQKLRTAFNLIPVFQPRSIVCHLQYEDNKHGYVYEKWFNNIIETWSELLDIAQSNNTPVMFENTYETSPNVHKHLLTELDSELAGFCLDVGHLLAFSKTNWQKWLPELLPWLGHLHLHDNDGSRDEHLAPGQGNFDFLELFTFLKKNDCHPIITFEPHSENDLWRTFEFLLKNNILSNI